MRRVPPAVVIAVALIAARMLFTAAYVMSSDLPPFPSWYWGLSSALTYTIMPLLVVGMLELRQRGAAVGFGLVVVLLAVQTRLLVDTELWLKPEVREAINFSFLAAHLVAMGFLARAVWARRPGLAVAAIASAILTNPPSALARVIFSTFAASYRDFMLVEMALRIPELIILVLLSIDLARESEARPVVAADGMRHASRALCGFSAITALVGIQVVHQAILLTVLAAASLAWCAYGLFRAARAPMHRWLVTAAGAAILACMSVNISSLPRLDGRDYMPAQPATMILVLVAAAAFLTVAAKNVVDKIQLQAKGVGAIVMFVTALAIALFLVPQSQSHRSLVALDVLTGFVIALGAWMLSWLCRLAAQRLERSDGDLPTARVVSGPA